jgi:hypothetical protein
MKPAEIVLRRGRRKEQREVGKWSNAGVHGKHAKVATKLYFVHQ